MLHNNLKLNKLNVSKAFFFIIPKISSLQPILSVFFENPL